MRRLKNESSKIEGTNIRRVAVIPDFERIKKFVAQARQAGIPMRVIRKKCLNWGVAFGLAEQIAKDSSETAYTRSFVEEAKSEQAFKDETHFRGWVTTVAKRDAIDRYRRVRALPTVELDERIMVDLATSSKEDDRVKTCLETLKTFEQQLLWLTYSKDSLDEIADDLRIRFPEDILTLEEIANPDKPLSDNALRIRILKMRKKAKRKWWDCLDRAGYKRRGDSKES